MDSKRLIGKIAADKDNRKLGKIIDIKLHTGETAEEKKFYVLILVQKPLRKDITILIEADKALKIDTQYVWFDITQKEFKEELKKAVGIQKSTDKHGLQLKEQSFRGAYGTDITGLGKKPKERKR
ncbi:MAG: hypothetical protein FK733_05475 [Asgard group archaeon]|nr:hypothetical protein [Asgard group archaeon]